MAVITISRQYGSGGDEIAERVCETLGYNFFDKRLMTKIAADVGLSDTQIIDFSEDTYQTQGFLDRVLAWRSPRRVSEIRTWGETTTGVKTKEITTLDEGDTITLVQSAIHAIYERGNVVIVGRGGQAILKDKPDVLHVRIEAPYNDRVKRLLERENFSPGGAKEAVLKHDRASSEYLRRFYSIDWADSMNYDLVINTGKLGVSAATHIIVNALGNLLPNDRIN